MLARKHICILANNINLLYCSALAELLSQRESFHVDIIEEASRELSSGSIKNHIDLLIFFGGDPVCGRTSKIAGMREKDTKLLLVLGSEEKYAVRHLANLGPDGVMSSGATYSELLTAINTLAVKNLKYISPLSIASLSGLPIHEPLSCLSNKELDIALFVTKGKRNFEIAAELNISPKTVNTYKSRIYKKLRIANDMQLFKLALESGVGDHEVSSGLTHSRTPGTAR